MATRLFRDSMYTEKNIRMMVCHHCWPSHMCQGQLVVVLAGGWAGHSIYAVDEAPRPFHSPTRLSASRDLYKISRNQYKALLDIAGYKVWLSNTRCHSPVQVTSNLTVGPVPPAVSSIQFSCDKCPFSGHWTPIPYTLIKLVPPLKAYAVWYCTILCGTKLCGVVHRPRCLVHEPQWVSDTLWSVIHAVPHGMVHVPHAMWNMHQVVWNTHQVVWNTHYAMW